MIKRAFLQSIKIFNLRDMVPKIALMSGRERRNGFISSMYINFNAITKKNQNIYITARIELFIPVKQIKTEKMITMNAFWVSINSGYCKLSINYRTAGTSKISHSTLM